MQDRELYRQILGIEAPWWVERVDLKLAEGEVHVYLEHEEMGHWACPECGGGCQRMTIKGSGVGGIWTPANIRPFCTLDRRERNAGSMAYGW